MKIRYIVLNFVIIVLLAVIGIFLYERAHVSLYDEDDEFADGHIPGAINVANESIGEFPAELPDKNQTIYVYCRSGNRSKQAAEKLVKLGYSNIIEFGGIIDWAGEIEK